MNAPANPPRLKQSPEFGKLLHEAQQQQGISPLRLAENASMIHAKIAAGAIGAKATVAALVVKIAVPLLVGAGAIGSYLYLSERHEAQPNVVSAHREAQPIHAPAALPNPEPAIFDAGDDDDADEEIVHVAHLTDHTAQNQTEPSVPTAATPRPKQRVINATNAKNNDAQKTSNTDDVSAETNIDTSLVEVPPPPPPTGLPPSRLPEQLQRFNAAKDAAENHDYTAAIAAIDSLLRDFPQTPLKAESELIRADCLIKANRFNDAILATTRLIDDPQHKGRHGELWRVLGDLYLQTQHCPRALEAYRHALTFPLTPTEKETILLTQKKCSTQ